MPNFTAGAALTALRTQLLARDGLSGVTVATGGLGSDTPREAITFDRVEQDEERAAMDRVQETYELVGTIYIAKPGKDETVIAAARDRAFALLTEVRNQLHEDETINSTVTTSYFRSFTLEQDISDPPGRVASIEFRVELVALAAQA